MFNHNPSRYKDGQIKNLSNRRSTLRRADKALARVDLENEVNAKRRARGLEPLDLTTTSKPKPVQTKKPPTKQAQAYSMRNSQEVLAVKFARPWRK